jgi:hypothetical protein
MALQSGRGGEWPPQSNRKFERLRVTRGQRRAIKRLAEYTIKDTKKRSTGRETERKRRRKN